MWRTAYAWTIGVLYTVFWASLGILTWPLSPGGDLYLRLVIHVPERDGDAAAEAARAIDAAYERSPRDGWRL